MVVGRRSTRCPPLLAALGLVVAGSSLFGCASTREVLQQDHYIARVLVESNPPGSTVYVNKKPVGKAPVVVRQPYSHLKEEITFGGQRTGIALLSTGAAGVAVGGGMVALGVAAIDGESSGPAVSLLMLGLTGATYGLIGVIYGTVAMVGSPAPREVLRTLPYKLRIGVRGSDGVYHEVLIANLDRDAPLVNFGEMTRLMFDHGTGKWSAPGLKTLSVKPQADK